MLKPLEFKTRKYWIGFNEIEKKLKITGHLQEIHLVNKNIPNLTKILFITRVNLNLKNYWRLFEEFKKSFNIKGEVKDIQPVNTDTIDGEQVYIKTEEKMW